ncbi:dienelactone hydrolase family protein [bacterium]|nr:MAG: dienelactone hydrolase family protein [bacterium]
MIVKPVAIKTLDGVADGYVLYPDEDGRYPAVIFYMDGIGLRPVLIDFARRVAERGYFVLLPNLFYRSGKAPLFNYEEFLKGINREETMGQMMALIGQLTPDAIERDSTSYLKFLDTEQQVQPGLIATTGYCMGGSVSLRTAAYHPDRVVAAASFHGGRLATEDLSSPHLLVDRITARLYIGHATNDRSCPQEQIEKLENALNAANVSHRTEIYEAGHGWTMPDVAVYDEAAAEKALQCLFTLLEETLPSAFERVTNAYTPWVTGECGS